MGLDKLKSYAVQHLTQQYLSLMVNEVDPNRVNELAADLARQLADVLNTEERRSMSDWKSNPDDPAQGLKMT